MHDAIHIPVYLQINLRKSGCRVLSLCYRCSYSVPYKTDIQIILGKKLQWSIQYAHRVHERPHVAKDVFPVHGDYAFVWFCGQLWK